MILSKTIHFRCLHHKNKPWYCIKFILFIKLKLIFSLLFPLLVYLRHLSGSEMEKTLMYIKKIVKH